MQRPDRFASTRLASAALFLIVLCCRQNTRLHALSRDDNRSHLLHRKYGHTHVIGHKHAELRATIPASTKTGKSLLFYVFSHSDPEYLHNFGFFVRFGMLSPSVDHVVIIQDAESMPVEDKYTLAQVVANVPSKTIVLHHVNECYDTGSVGWAMKQPSVAARLDDYDFFIVLNSSVKGPFLPPFFPNRKEWHRVLTKRLGGHNGVHLVGPTISCEPTYNKRLNQNKISPHVQTWLLAVDRVGLDVLRRDGRPFKCHRDRDDAIWDGEVGLSRVMLEAGHNIDCLLEPYQGVDWRVVKDAACNNRKNPMIGNMFYGTTLPPYATIFTKYKKHQQMDERSTATTDALVLSKWMLEKW